ncbi:unnamed protein product [Aphanomyces euteiches]
MMGDFQVHGLLGMAPPPTCLPATEMNKIERDLIDWALYITSGLSAIGCLYVIVLFFKSPRASHNVTSMFVVTLAIFELVIAIAKAPATHFVQFDMFNNTYVKTPTQPQLLATMCQVQSFFIYVFMLQAVLWTGCTAFSLLRWVVYRDTEERLLSRFWIYLFSTSAFSLLCGLLAALPVYPYNGGDAASLYGFARTFCWMRDPKLSLQLFIPFVVATLLFTAAVMIKIRSVVSARAKQHAMLGLANDDVLQIQRTLFFIVFAFFCLHSPATLYRFMQEFTQNPRDPVQAGTARTTYWCSIGATNVLSIVGQVFINSQGFVNAILYGRFIDPNDTDRRSMTLADRNAPSVYLEDAVSSVSGSVAPSSDESASIFASTFNMAEGAVPTEEDLALWIPPGHDVYVIGLQECLNLQAMRGAIGAHLRRINGKVYVEYGREIGRKETMLGYHGFIAITIYAATSDVQAGHFQVHLDSTSKVNRGVNLIGLGRASNKGAVGFAFRLYNLTFAVVSCHLASGTSKIKKRHRDGSQILSSLHLQSIDNEFDCHLMAHHTIFMGDLNYRLTMHDASPHAILKIVTAVVNSNLVNNSMKRGQVFSHEEFITPVVGQSSRLGYREEQDDGYTLTTSPAAGMPRRSEPSLEDFPNERQSAESTMSTLTAPSLIDASWKTLMEHDELKCSMEHGEIFHEFEEARIAFAPTFRRVVGKMLHLQSQWTLHQVAQVYTTVVNKGETRVPSYTDRILFHSLPGLRDRLACVQYTSAECILTSDHKPVSCIFHALVDKRSPSQTPVASPQNTEQKEPSKLRTYNVSLSSLELQWGPPLEAFSSDGEAVDSMHPRLTKDAALASLEPPSTDTLRLRSVFPLPCEDDFAEERKLAEVADHFHASGTKHQQQQRRLQPTWKLQNWAQLANGGTLRLSALLVPKRHFHVALHFITPLGTTVGQGIISLTEASTRPGRKFDFVASLTTGGRRVGEITGKVSLTNVPAV